MSAFAGKRAVKGLIVTILGLATRFLTQFVQIPLLYSAWSAGKASAWLLLWTLPSYMALTVSALSAVGGNLAVAASLENDVEAARAAYRASSRAIVLSNAVLAVVCAFSFRLLLQRPGWEMDSTEVGWTVGFIALYSIIAIQSAAQEPVYRYGGDWGGYGLWELAASAGELVILALVVHTTQWMPLLPASLAGWRLATMLLIRRHARRNWPEVYGHVDGDRLAATMRRMVGPFLGFICMPLIFLINLQAYPAIVATFYGSAAFATFIASRTLARAIDQICNGAYAVLFNEFAYADLSREREFVIGLVGATTLVIGALAAASLIFLATLGSVIFKLWTIGKVAYSLPLVLLFGLAACARCLALPSASLIASRNRHVPVTVISLVTSSLLVCCGVVLGLSRVWFVWLAGCTLVAEVIQLAATLAVTARMLELGLLAYIHRVAGSAPRFVGVVVRTVAARLPGGAKSRAAE